MTKNTQLKTIMLDGESFNNETYIYMCDHIGDGINRYCIDFECDENLFNIFLNKFNFLSFAKFKFIPT